MTERILGLLDDEPRPAPSAAASAAPAPGGLPPRAAALALALVAALLLFRLGAVPLVGPDEPRYARVAVEMSRSGDLVTPTLQGTPWLEKPILYYWLASAAFGALGETETAARLPSVLAALVLVGSIGIFGARVYGATAGLVALVASGTSLIVFAYGRAASMDMLIAASCTVGIGLLGLRLLGIAGPLSVPFGWAALGVGVLAKGPLALVVAGLAIGPFLAFRRDLRGLRRVVTPGGIAALAVVASPWYVAVLLAQGQHFVDVFVLDHNLRRFTSTVHNHPGPPTYYVPVLLGLLFPWSALVPPALAGVRPRRSARDLFVLGWLLGPLLFFSAAGSKLPGYILPCVAPLAILMGPAAVDRLAGTARRDGWWRVGALLVLVLGALLATSPALLRARGETGWTLLVLPGVWGLVIAMAYARRVSADTPGALALLRVGAPGLLVLVTLAAPAILARRESGRDLALAARGRDIVAWGAWRTAWMSAYFYNDARVREVSGLAEVLDAAHGGAVVLAGPGEARRLERLAGWRGTRLAGGPRGNVLLRLQPGPAPVAIQPR